MTDAPSPPAPVRTRFAPSPTGMLHIGGARTALFNYLFSKHHGGEYLLRIEDTDRARSTEAAVQVILDGLHWLGLDADAPPVFQSTRQARHAEVAHALVEVGRAYRCYATAEELREMRERAVAEGRPPRYDGRWRDRDPADAPAERAPAIRIKMPRDGETVVDDLVQGEVRVGNAELDDMIILRSDGTPTYQHAVVVDDHDMGITHVIRGDDHLTNTFRQLQVYLAMGWEVPRFGHVPMIHGAGRGQAVQATRRAVADRVSRPGFPARGGRELPAPARLGTRRFGGAVARGGHPSVRHRRRGAGAGAAGHDEADASERNLDASGR